MVRRFRNGLIFTGRDGFRYGDFEVRDGKFSAFFADHSLKGGTDLQGARVIPGLVDIHIHGAMGADFSDGDAQALGNMAGYLAANGVTSFVPTSMTLPYETLAAAFQSAKNLHDNRPAGCARIMGIHMEGPFLSREKKGSQNGRYLREPDYDAFRKLYEGCGGLIRIVDLAPEAAGAESFTAKAADLCVVSAAHTAADYEEASRVFDAGASHLTHLFNAMPPVHHRRPGVIGAASERDEVTAELICDGIHVHPSAVRMAFRLFPGRICLISDSLRCCGMPDGEYELGGQKVFLRGHAVRLADGTIAGAAANLFTDLRNAIRFGIPETEAVLAATMVPAKVIGADQEVGSIAQGKDADFVICNDDYSIQQVYLDGNPVRAACSAADP